MIKYECDNCGNENELKFDGMIEVRNKCNNCNDENTFITYLDPLDAIEYGIEHIIDKKLNEKIKKISTTNQNIIISKGKE